MHPCTAYHATKAWSIEGQQHCTSFCYSCQSTPDSHTTSKIWYLEEYQPVSSTTFPSATLLQLVPFFSLYNWASATRYSCSAPRAFLTHPYFLLDQFSFSSALMTMNEASIHRSLASWRPLCPRCRKALHNLLERSAAAPHSPVQIQSSTPSLPCKLLAHSFQQGFLSWLIFALSLHLNQPPRHHSHWSPQLYPHHRQNIVFLLQHDQRFHESVSPCMRFWMFLDTSHWRSAIWHNPISMCRLGRITSVAYLDVIQGLECILGYDLI